MRCKADLVSWIVRRSVVHTPGKVSETPLPILKRASFCIHPENAIWKTLLIQLGKMSRELAFATARYAYQTDTGWLLLWF